MTTKYFCDVCGKESSSGLLIPFLLGPEIDSDHGPWTADVCKDCSDIVLKPFKTINTQMIVKIPEPKKTAKSSKRRTHTGVAER